MVYTWWNAITSPLHTQGDVSAASGLLDDALAVQFAVRGRAVFQVARAAVTAAQGNPQEAIAALQAALAARHKGGRCATTLLPRGLSM